MGRIHVLDDAVINKIAAGEVVERPASVVKEMVENALDAGATAISVSLSQGGTSSIVVADNGCGMDRDDAHMALRRHATSKIAAADDLFCIQTMGFRGEALASIASVSRLSLATVLAGSDVGIKLQTTGGEDVQEIPWSGSQGTTIAVEELFFNVPARAKFLKAPATELSYCHELMQAFALCHPEVGFTLTHNGKEQFRVPPIVGSSAATASTGVKGEKALRERAQAVLGKDAAELMYVTAESRYGRLEALISPPGVEKATGKHLFTFVNGRWVKDKTLRYGVLRGYHSHLLKGRFPVATLYLSMDPSLVDVNAHPAKTEVRFQYPGEVQNLIALAIRDKIRTGVWAQSHGAGERPTDLAFPAKKNTPRNDGDDMDDAGLGILAAAETPVDGVAASEFPSDASTSDFSSHSSPRHSRSLAVTTTTRSFGVREARPVAWEPTPGLKGQVDTPERVRREPPLAPVVDKASLDALLAGAPPPVARSSVASSPSLSQRHDDVLLAPASSLPENNRSAHATIAWDELHFVGAFARCFLLFEGSDRLLVVDQHAFHERILFEKLSRDQSLLSQSQRLLVPEALDLSLSDVAHLMENKAVLKGRGFDFETEGPGTLVVKAVPAILAGRDMAGLFADLAKGLKGEEGGTEPGDSNAELARLVLATTACHAAVRAGEELPPNELKQLLTAAREVDFVENCPHGRRVFRWWTRGQVAGWFDR